MSSLSRRQFVTRGAVLAAAGLGALSFFASAAPAAAQGATTTTTSTSSTSTARPRRRRGPGFGRGMLGADLQAVATALNLTTAQVQQQVRAGKSIAQIAQTQNVPLQTVKDAIVAAAKTRLDQAVAAGRLTSAQETQQLTRLQTNLDQRLNAVPGASLAAIGRAGRAHPRPAGRRTGWRTRPSA